MNLINDNNEDLTYISGECLFCKQFSECSNNIIHYGVHNIVLICLDDMLPESLLICPKRHTETVFDLNIDEWNELYYLILRCKKSLEDNYKNDGFTLGWNCYPAGGQSVNHAHLHLIPRFRTEVLTRGKGIRSMLKRKENRAKAHINAQKRIKI